MPVVETIKVCSTQQMHLLTFDVEHWYEGFRYRDLDGWQGYPPRDDKMVERLLDKLSDTGQLSTMFFTGRYAEEFPHVVRRAAREGHEIASHSYSHRVLSRMGSIEVFKEDFLRSVGILEDISGCKVKGYRAPKWSIVHLAYLEVLNILHEAGLDYDSSVFPRIGGGDKKVYPHQVDLGGGSNIWELPATTYPLLGLRLPVGGGLYFRLFPAWVTRKSMDFCRRNNQPSIAYLHPYDLDITCPRLSGGNQLFQWLRYYGVDTAFDRLAVMLEQYRFSTIAEWVKNNNGVMPVKHLGSQ